MVTRAQGEGTKGYGRGMESGRHPDSING